MAKKKTVRYYSPKRRKIYAQGDDINALELFEKFNWICHICSEKIDRRLRVPNWRAATIDHILPLAQGGTHTWDNTAPAHYKCNIDKGACLPAVMGGTMDDSLSVA